MPKVLFPLMLLVLMAIPLILGAGCSTFSDLFIEKDLTKIQLDQVLNNGKPTLADFGWRDCVPCKKMKVVLENLAAKYRGKLNVVIIEVYNHPDLMDRYEIDAIPVQVLFDSQGKELIRHEGFWPEQEIQAELIKAGIN